MKSDIQQDRQPVTHLVSKSYSQTAIQQVNQSTLKPANETDNQPTI